MIRVNNELLEQEAVQCIVQKIDLTEHLKELVTTLAENIIQALCMQLTHMTQDYIKIMVSNYFTRLLRRMFEFKVNKQSRILII